MGIEREISGLEEKRDAASLREELEIAWLRGWAARQMYGGDPIAVENRGGMATDYAERVVGGSTRPSWPKRYLPSSKDENAS